MVKRFLRKIHHGQKGFTLIELLIVIAILGIIAAIIIPNAAGFMISGRLNAANTEVQNVKTAAVGYMAEHESAFAATSTSLYNADPNKSYLSGLPKTVYTFNTVTGPITGVAGVVGTLVDAVNWPNLTFVLATQQWIRTP